MKKASNEGVIKNIHKPEKLLLYTYVTYVPT